jgi:hypothetical protein
VNSKFDFSVQCYSSKLLFDEIQSYLSTPNTLTSTTTSLALGLSKGKPLALNWVTSEVRRWAIPDDHPAQNKWLCYNSTNAAAEKVNNSFLLN